LEAALASLRAWIWTEAARARELVARLDALDDPDLADTLVLTLADLDPSVGQDAELVRGFCDRARAAPTERGRASALRFLAQANELTEEQLRSVARIGREDGGAEVRRAAIEALSAYVERNVEAAPTIAPALREALRSDADADVRMEAAIGLPIREDPGAAIPALAEALGRERVEDARIALVNRLGDAPATHRAQVMGLLEGIADGGESVGVRRQALVAAVHVGGDAALPLLERIAAAGGPLAQEAADYGSILRTGERDFARIIAARERLELGRGLPEGEGEGQGEGARDPGDE
ncbi:MAG: HEAT repeat domain-containing protein, partial [Planctomycetes bacterium]|nr:HEAT repeat domain-containing protein [Planctomycetota bacterium]